MLKLLIVDDEVSIIQLIKKLIRLDLSYSIVGETTDGKSALSMIEGLKPDIVITDIRMPGLNGIELIEETRKREMGTEFIIISGYKDFQYAQNAIRYGAAAYLLKPIKADELNGAIEQICKKRGETEKLKIRIADMENTLAQNRTVKRRKILFSYIRQALHLSNVPEKRITNSLPDFFNIQQGIFAVMILKLDFEENVEASFVAENVEVLGEKYYRAISSSCYDLESYCLATRYYLFFHTGETRLQDLQQKMEHLICDRISEYNMYRVTIAVGIGVKQEQKIQDAFTSAEYALMQRLYKGSGKLLICSERENFSENVNLSKEIRQRLERAVLTLSAETFFDTFRKTYEEILTFYRKNPYYIRKYLEQAVFYVQECLWKENGSEKDGCEMQEKTEQMEALFLQKVDSCCSTDEMYEACVFYLQEELEKIQKKQREGMSRPIKQMKKFICEHYGENILLDDIVGAAELSNAYGSSIFKKETGMTITNYLTSVRMEEAQRLIRETNLTITEIAYKVGYTDTRYFSKLFIKEVGIKPVDYRKFYN